VKRSLLAAVSACLLLAVPAAAQDFELDLSEEKPAKPPPELRPTIAVLSVTAADKEEVSVARAKQLEAEILKQLAQGEDFQTIIEPPLVAKTLDADAAKAQACADWGCFEAVAKKLKAHRAFRVTVAKAGVGSEVTFIAYDPGFAELMTLKQDSGEKAEKSFLGVAGKTQAQKDKEFIKKIAPFIKTSLAKLATPNGKISVDSPEASAAATIDGVEAGVGSFEAVVQRGSRTVRVAVAGFEPFEQSVTVEPLKTASVKVSLRAKPMEIAAPVVVKEEDLGPPIYARPGLYIAVAGAVAVGVGIAMGQMAMGVQNKVNAGGDPVDVTRAAAKSAPTQALLANILVGAGAAMVAGGTLWVILTPTKSAAPAVEPGGPASSTGAMLSVGGTF
jgi:hypothetical protein